VRTTLGPLDAAGRVPGFQQTRIGSFLMSAHGAEARLLSAALAMSSASLTFGVREIELHSQLSREMEILSLLTRAISWQPDPVLLWMAGQWELAWLPQPVDGVPGLMQGPLIDAAAFGYAVHSAIRPAVLLPQNIAATDPFAVALRRIEADGSRVVQAQLRFLKSAELAPARDAISASVDRRHRQVRRLWTELLSTIDVSPDS
jgi:hypothetical protein